MSKAQKTWLVVTIILQWITAGLHSLSFISKPVGQDDTENQMLSLMLTHHMDMGAGFQPTMWNLFTFFSFSFTLLLIFSALLNMLLIRHSVAGALAKNMVALQVIIFAACFSALIVLTFIIPIICVGLILASCIICWRMFQKNIL